MLARLTREALRASTNMEGVRLLCLDSPATSRRALRTRFLVFPLAEHNGARRYPFV